VFTLLSGFKWMVVFGVETISKANVSITVNVPDYAVNKCD